jgi:hypothetical protein
VTGAGRVKLLLSLPPFGNGSDLQNGDRTAGLRIPTTFFTHCAKLRFFALWGVNFNSLPFSPNRGSQPGPRLYVSRSRQPGQSINRVRKMRADPAIPTRRARIVMMHSVSRPERPQQNSPTATPWVSNASPWVSDASPWVSDGHDARSEFRAEVGQASTRRFLRGEFVLTIGHDARSECRAEVGQASA